MTAQANAPDSRFEWSPDQADFGQILIGKKEKFKVDLKNIDTVEAKLAIVGEPTKEFVKKYKIKKDKLKPKQSTTVEIEIRNDIPLGAFKTALTLEAVDNLDSRITIPITGSIVSKLTSKSEASRKPAQKKPITRKTAQSSTVSQKGTVKPKTTVKTDTVAVTPGKPEASKPVIIRDDSDLK